MVGPTYKEKAQQTKQRKNLNVVPRRQQPQNPQQQKRKKIEQQKPQKREEQQPQKKEIEEVEEKIVLNENQTKILEGIKEKIYALRPGEELFITPKELALLQSNGQKALEKFLKENKDSYYYAYTRTIIEENGDRTDLEGTYLYIYKKREQYEPIEKT